MTWTIKQFAAADFGWEVVLGNQHRPDRAFPVIGWAVCQELSQDAGTPEVEGTAIYPAIVWDGDVIVLDPDRTHSLDFVITEYTDPGTKSALKRGPFSRA